MLYYLGEILRVEICSSEQGKCDQAKIAIPALNLCGSEEAPLFRATRISQDPENSGGPSPLTQDEKIVVQVEYSGRTYAITEKASEDQDPRGCKLPQSMHALTLIGQLIGQNKEASDLPKTGVVTVVGPGAR